jgi:hypothetical protein
MGFVARPMPLWQVEIITLVKYLVVFFFRPQAGPIQAFSIESLGKFMDRPGFGLDKEPAFR